MKTFKLKIYIMVIINVLLWIAILWPSNATAHEVKMSNKYSCGGNTILINNYEVDMNGWDFKIVDNNTFEKKFKRANIATFKNHTLILSYNVGSKLNQPKYYIIDFANLQYTYTIAGKTGTGPCLDF